MENPWAICYGLSRHPVETGIVIKESKTCLMIKYSEGQMYGPEAWEPEYVKRFANPHDMLKKYAEDTGLVLSYLETLFRRKFASALDNNKPNQSEQK